MAKTVKKKTLIKACDALFSKYILHKNADRDGYVTCITCGKRAPIAQMDAGHFIGRRIQVLRYDERNVHPQCRYCNRFGLYGRGEQYLFSKALDGIEPGRAEDLMRRAHQGGTVTAEYLKHLRDELKLYWKELEQRQIMEQRQGADDSGAEHSTQGTAAD